MSPEAACAVGLAIAEALSYAHTQTPRVLHRDVKPGNVLFDTTGLLEVTDFGIAKIVKASAAMASVTGLGTPTYAAPCRRWRSAATTAPWLCAASITP